MIGTDKIKLAYYFFGTLIPRLISFTFLPILSFFLSKNELGTYDLLLTGLSLLIPIITLQIEEAYYRWHFEAPNNLVKTVIYFSCVSHILLFIVSIILFYYQLVQFNITLILALFSSSFLLLFQFIARSLNRMAVYSTAAFINSLGVLVFTYLLYLFQKININSIAIAYISSNLIALFYLIFKLKLYKTLLTGSFNYQLLTQLLKFSVPLIPTTISWWLVSFSNRFIITLHLGVGFNGSYAVAARLPSLLVVLNSIFLLFVQDVVFKNVATQKNEINYNTIFKKFFQLQLTLAIVLVTFSKLLVKLLFANIYTDTYKLVPILIVGILLTNLCAFFAVFFLAQKRTFVILISTILGGILNIIFTHFTIRHIGLYAPALGTAIGFLFIFCTRVYLLKKYQIFKLQLEHYSGLLFGFIMASLSLYFYNIYSEFFFMIASILLFYFFNRILLTQFVRQALLGVTVHYNKYKN